MNNFSELESRRDMSAEKHRTTTDEAVRLECLRRGQAEDLPNTKISARLFMSPLCRHPWTDSDDVHILGLPEVSTFHRI